MKTLRHIAIAIAAVVFAEVVLCWVITSNLEAGIYPIDADSIGIPLLGSLVYAAASLVLLISAILCTLSQKLMVCIGSLFFLAAAVVTGLFALYWAVPNHYSITVCYAILSIGSAASAFFTFRSQTSNNSPS